MIYTCAITRKWCIIRRLPEKLGAYQAGSDLNAINTLRPRQNGRHFPDDIFKYNFLNENIRISIKISLKFVPKGSITNIPALVQIMAWRRPGDMPLSEPMMDSLLTHICVTWPQWVKQRSGVRLNMNMPSYYLYRDSHYKEKTILSL